MANLTTLVATIRAAQQGEDVRDAIADTLEAVNVDNIAIIQKEAQHDIKFAELTQGEANALASADAAADSEVIATAKAVVATTQAGIATTKAAEAAAAKIAAENARAAAELAEAEAEAARIAAELAEAHSETAEINSKASEVASAGSAATATTKAGESAASAAESLASKNLAETAKNQTQAIKDAAVLALTDTTGNAEVIDSRRGQASLGTKIDLIDSQLAEITNNGQASLYGVNPTIGTADATTLLNNYFSTLKAKGLKYAYFDKPHTYKVSGVLSGARNLILFGNAKIESSNIVNCYINISPTLIEYNGKYNKSPLRKNQFTQFNTALGASRDINISIWGDSISTGGTDCLNVGYNTIDAGALEQGPNSITTGDSYYQRLMDMITGQFKDNIFNFYNRSSGGTVIQDYGSDKTFNSVTKSWAAHVKDTAPDLLIIGWGINQTTIASAKAFKYYLNAVLTYVNANFSPIPSIALLTSPRPCYSPEDTWGALEIQQAVDMSAHTIRTFGEEKGCYIIDVNKISNLKRTGKIFENPFMEAIAETYAATDAIVSGTATKVGYTYTTQTAGTEIIIPINSKSFVVAFDLKFSGFTDGVENLSINYNYLVGYIRNCLMVKPLSGGAAAIESYANIGDVAHYTSPTKSYFPGISWNDGVYRRITFEKRDDIIDVFIDGARVLRDRVQINNTPSEIRLNKNGGSIGLITVQNLVIYKGEYKQFLPTLTESEMFGDHVNLDYTTKKPYGGNGVNHPSSIGLEETYVPAMREFVEDLSRL
ncbi:MAG: hypothetical protein Q7J65_09210 [Candidatus Marinimicrobia bacterium]|nr:hypothetical protein [Candidatus Neomarinimicrobiota bacterium]